MKKFGIVLIMMIFLIGGASAFDVTVNDYDPLPAEAGKAVNVWFKVENPSDEVETNVNIAVTPKDGLELSAGEDSEKRVGILQEGSSQIVMFRLFVKDDAFEGQHLVGIDVKSDSSTFKKDLGLEIVEKDFKEVDLSVGNIDSDPTRIKPDDNDVKLDVTILNLGDGTAKGVIADLTNLPEGITLAESYSGTALLGNIESDGLGVATFYFDVDESVKPEEYTGRLKVTYKFKPDEDEEDYEFEEKQLPLKISIKPIPLYEITKVELTPEVLTAGDEDIKLRITIKNIGEETGDSVRIKAYGKTEQPINFEDSSDYIAPSLKPGEEGQGTLEFRIEDDANLQTYYLDLEIKNIVNEDVVTYNKKVPVEISNPKPDNPWQFVFIGVVLILVVIIYLVIKGIMKRRKKPKAKKLKSDYDDSYLDKIEKKGK